MRNETRRLGALWIVVGWALCASPGQAIIWSGPDDGMFPYVGLIALQTSEGAEFCSGTLISDSAFVFASHCVGDATRAVIWFDNEVTDSGFPTDCVDSALCRGADVVIHPEWDDFESFPDSHDVAMALLDAPIDPSGDGTFGELPELGALDGLDRQRGRKNRDFIIVGYGIQAIIPRPVDEFVRYVGFPQLVELGSGNSGGFHIHVTGSPGRDHPGGMCFGDSGGPAFVPGSTTVIGGVASFVLSPNCVGAGFYYRLDKEPGQEFIDGVLDP